MEVYEPGGEPLSLSEGVLRLEEARQYFVSPGAGAPEGAVAWLGPLALEWDGAERAFRLPISQWIGAQLLRVAHAGKETTTTVQVVPRADKLSAQAWTVLLSDLEAWLPSLSVGDQPGLQGSVVAGGSRIPHLVEAALPLIPALLESIRAVIAAPRQRTGHTELFVPAHQVRRVERTALGWLERHPEASRALSARWDTDADARRPPLVPVGHATETLDHPANRYVTWLVRSIARDLGAYAEALDGTARGSDAPAGTHADDWLRWCTSRAEALREAAGALWALERRSWLARLAPSPPTEAAMAVVVDDPRYARLHRLGRRFRSPLFQFGRLPGAPGAATRPSYELYELWTFLALRRLLGALLPEHRWTSQGLEPLATLDEPLDGASFEATGPGGTLRLLFNPTFRGYLSRGTAPRFSISGERRPDLVLLWESEGRRRWVCLDAKYRVARDALADAFESAHLYRDGLRWPEWGGRCEAAVLLAPAELPACAPWFAPGFVAEHQVGVFRLTPGAEAAPLSAWLGRFLGLCAEMAPAPW
ncbi:DUF2357 domain-containing protein [Myxococcus sp. RHSTA-1-4]|uniref:DUF2357 domain-containing protein n=1 Tax=Myxococcus sp. RHSTA-1-4 TaxID=2874601 RepID=UPI001CBBF787|nr:DUF2357 domain-containing protein [Myxococcus sp. RHSTA-1-4]MBZ4419948.1 restriction endonuclease-like protein [Myxococcus sp. RHSTA-1-4]